MISWPIIDDTSPIFKIGYYERNGFLPTTDHSWRFRQISISSNVLGPLWRHQHGLCGDATWEISIALSAPLDARLLHVPQPWIGYSVTNIGCCWVTVHLRRMSFRRYARYCAISCVCLSRTQRPPPVCYWFCDGGCTDTRNILHEKMGYESAFFALAHLGEI